MTITIKPLARGERRREVRIGRTGKGYLAKARRVWRPASHPERLRKIAF